MMSRVPLVPLTLLLTLFLGCSSRSTDDVPEPEEQVETPDEIKARKLADTKRLYEAGLSRLQKVNDRSPTDLDSHIENLDHFKSRFKGTRYEAEIDKMIEDLDKSVVKTAKEKLDAVFVEVDRLIGMGDFPGAEELLDVFLSDLEATGMRCFRDTPSLAEWEKKLHRTAHLSAAENEANDALRRSEGYSQLFEHAKAVAALDAYPDKFRDTVYYKDVEARLQEYYEQYKTDKAESAKTEEIPWTKLGIDKYLGDWHSHAKDGSEVWKVDDETIEADNSTDEPAYLIAAVGDDWVDFNVQFEIKVPKKEFLIGLRRHYAKKERFMSVRVEDLGSDDWVPIVVRVEQGNVSVINQDTGDELYDRRMSFEFPKGGFAFLLKPGAQMFLRNVQYRVLVEEKDEPGDGDSGEDDSGKSDSGEKKK